MGWWYEYIIHLLMPSKLRYDRALLLPELLWQTCKRSHKSNFFGVVKRMGHCMLGYVQEELRPYCFCKAEAAPHTPGRPQGYRATTRVQGDHKVTGRPQGSPLLWTGSSWLVAGVVALSELGTKFCFRLAFPWTRA